VGYNHFDSSWGSRPLDPLHVYNFSEFNDNFLYFFSGSEIFIKFCRVFFAVKMDIFANFDAEFTANSVDNRKRWLHSNVLRINVFPLKGSSLRLCQKQSNSSYTGEETGKYVGMKVYENFRDFSDVFLTPILYVSWPGLVNNSDPTPYILYSKKTK